jgi:hypothetical protein
MRLRHARDEYRRKASAYVSPADMFGMSDAYIVPDLPVNVSVDA